MSDAGGDRSTVMKMAGHKSPWMVWLYDSVTKEEAKRANSKLGAYLASSTKVLAQGLKPGIPLTRDSVTVSSS